MKLEYCRYLLEINQLHSISAAAKSLHIGQTTLNAIVKRVEEELGFTIFQRTPKGVTVTETGGRLMEALWEINVHYEELLRIKKRDASDVPLITILGSPLVFAWMALPLVQSFSAFRIQGNLFFEDAPNKAICQHITEGVANIGLVYFPEKPVLKPGQAEELLHAESLLEDGPCVLVTEDHPFAHREAVDIEELSAEPLVTVSLSGSVLGRWIPRDARLVRFPSPGEVVQAVTRHGLVGILVRSVSRYMRERNITGVQLIPLLDRGRPVKLELCLVTYKKRMRYQENIAVSCIREYFRKLEEE